MPSAPEKFLVVAYDGAGKPVRVWAGGSESRSEMLACDLRKQFCNLTFEVEQCSAERRSGR